MERELKFPQDFLWGTAVSAYQVEGGINCDWSTPHQKIGGGPAGKACDHYNLYEQDFDLMEKLNLNAFRFSIEWSRIEPEPGKFNQKEIEHYRKYLKSLKARGITTMVTLHHFTNPIWLAKMGGWTNKKVVFYFSRFSCRMLEEYKDLVDFWLTINEPMIYNGLVYFQERWPDARNNIDLLWANAKKNPSIIEKRQSLLSRIKKYLLQAKKLVSVTKVLRNQILAHKKVYQEFHNLKPGVKVSTANNNSFFEPFNEGSVLDRFSVFLADYFWNRYFLNKIKNHLDFIGLNYYFHNKIKFPFQIKNDNKIVSDLGWEIYPKGIYYVLKDLKKYNLPVHITENGVADKQDKLRQDFIKHHLRWVWQAIEEGVNVKGYFHWSLIDNFEWDLGFEPGFGLCEMDYQTMERKIRPSAYFYAKIAKENAIYLLS